MDVMSWMRGSSSPPAKQGKHYISDLKINATFRMADIADDTSSTEESSLAAEEKKRIIWDTDMDKVQKYFYAFHDARAEEDQSAEDERKECDAPSGAGTLTFDKVSEPKSERKAIKELGGHRQAAGFWKGKVPCYRQGVRVEHLSRRSNRATWSMTTVHVSPSTDDSVASDCLAYRVDVGRGDMRLEVEAQLEDLRLPLEPGEAVEVFSHRNEGEWIPGQISHGLRASNGYEICVSSLDSPGGHGYKIAGVAPHRIRRRYPALSEISVYYGSSVGWKHHRVHPAAGHDGNLLRPLPCEESSDTSLAIVDGEAKLEPWSLVPVCAESGEVNEVEQWVESYRIRRWNASETLCM